MNGVCCLKFLKVAFLLSPFEKLSHSLFYLSILFSTFFSSTMFQMHLWPSLHFFLGSLFLIHKEQHSKYNSYISVFSISKLRLFEHNSCFLLLNITLASLIRCIMPSLFFPSSVIVLPRYLNFDTKTSHSTYKYEIWSFKVFDICNKFTYLFSQSYRVSWYYQSFITNCCQVPNSAADIHQQGPDDICSHTTKLTTPMYFNP